MKDCIWHQICVIMHFLHTAFLHTVLNTVFLYSIRSCGVQLVVHVNFIVYLCRCIFHLWLRYCNFYNCVLWVIKVNSVSTFHQCLRCCVDTSEGKNSWDSSWIYLWNVEHICGGGGKGGFPILTVYAADPLTHPCLIMEWKTVFVQLFECMNISIVFSLVTIFSLLHTKTSSILYTFFLIIIFQNWLYI